VVSDWLERLHLSNSYVRNQNESKSSIFIPTIFLKRGSANTFLKDYITNAHLFFCWSHTIYKRYTTYFSSLPDNINLRDSHHQFTRRPAAVKPYSIISNYETPWMLNEEEIKSNPVSSSSVLVCTNANHHHHPSFRETLSYEKFVLDKLSCVYLEFIWIVEYMTHLP